MSDRCPYANEAPPPNVVTFPAGHAVELGPALVPCPRCGKFRMHGCALHPRCMCLPVELAPVLTVR